MSETPRPDGGHLSDEEIDALASDLNIPLTDDDGRRICQWEGCDTPLPEGSHVTRRYCDDHVRGGAKRRAKPQQAPPSVKINIPPPKAAKKSKDQEKVKAAAEALINLAAIGLEISGDATCGAVIKAQAPAIAEQLCVLSEYHPIIAKLLSPGEMTGETAAWIGLVLAAFPILVTVLVHHELISEQWAQRLASVVSIGALVGQASQPQP